MELGNHNGLIPAVRKNLCPFGRFFQSNRPAGEKMGDSQVAQCKITENNA
jgi:hypothetical protein